MSSAIQCKFCGASKSLVRRKAGSVWLEVLLWVLFVTPGFIYHMWRHKHNYYLCKECGHTAKTLLGIRRAQY
jgi:ribosomal protein L37AE/L43A